MTKLNTLSLRGRALAAHQAVTVRHQAEERARAAAQAQHKASDQRDHSQWSAEAMASLFGIADLPTDQEGAYPVEYDGLLFENAKGTATWDATRRRYLQSAPWQSLAVRIPCARCRCRGVDSIESAKTVDAIGWLIARHQQRLTDDGWVAALCDECRTKADEAYEAETEESTTIAELPADPPPPFAVTVAAGMLEIAEGRWRHEQAITGLDNSSEIVHPGKDLRGRVYRTRVITDAGELLSPASVAELLYALDLARKPGGELR